MKVEYSASGVTSIFIHEMIFRITRQRHVSSVILEYILHKIILFKTICLADKSQDHNFRESIFFNMCVHA